MAGTDRSSKGEVLDVVGENGGDLIKNFGVYLGAMGSHLFVSLKQQKSISSICQFTGFFWWVGVPFLWGRDYTCLVYHYIPSTYAVDNQ